MSHSAGCGKHPERVLTETRIQPTQEHWQTRLKVHFDVKPMGDCSTRVRESVVGRVPTAFWELLST